MLTFSISFEIHQEMSLNSMSRLKISLELFSTSAANPKLANEEARHVFNKTHPDSPLHSYWVVLRSSPGLCKSKLTCVRIHVLLSLVLC